MVGHQSYFTFVGLVLIIGALVVAPVVLALRARLRHLSPGMEKAGLWYVRTFHADWPSSIPGDEYGDVEYALERAAWESALCGDRRGSE